MCDNKSKPAAMQPIFQLRYAIVDQIHDYPTLVLLSMTCRTFYGAVHSSRAKLTKAFDNLEKVRIDGSPQELSVSRDDFCLTLCSTDCEVNHQHSTNRYEDIDTRGLETNSDIFRFNCGRLRTSNWIPCYGCKTIKYRWQQFFLDQLSGSMRLLCSGARSRRCVECFIVDEDRVTRKFRNDYARSKPKQAPHLKYLSDMPKEIPGFRLRCSLCRAVDWVKHRPTKKQARQRLCGPCFTASVADERRDRNDVFKEEFLRLAELDTGNVSAKARLKARASDITDRSEGERFDGGDQPLSFSTMYGFEVLRGVEMD